MSQNQRNQVKAKRIFTENLRRIGECCQRREARTIDEEMSARNAPSAQGDEGRGLRSAGEEENRFSNEAARTVDQG